MDRVVLRSPAELLATVPYMFGFQPTNSLVLLMFHGKRVTFQARADLLPADRVDEPARNLAEVTARNHLAEGRAAERDGPVGITLVGYGTEREFVPLANAVFRELGNRGLPVTTILQVDAGRYYDLLCDDPACCPPDGVPFDP